MFCKKGVLKIFQNSQESNCARVSFLIKLQPEAYNCIKKETLAQVFLVNSAKFLRTPFLPNTSWLLLLSVEIDLQCFLKVTQFYDTAQKMKFSIHFFSKCDQICSFLRIWSHLLKKSLMEIFFFCSM